MHNGTTVNRLLDDLGDGELAYWVAIDRYFEPIGQEWLRNALLCSTVANTSGNLKRSLDINHFMPIKRKPAKPESVAASHSKFLLWMSALGKTPIEEKTEAAP